MKLINPSYEILTEINSEEILKHIELAGRVCYKSENLIKEGSNKAFIKRIIESQHESVLEHFSISVRFICSRSISHQLIRHRLSSFSQESQRYCNYSKDKFDSEITFIQPSWYDEKTDHDFVLGLKYAESLYFSLISEGLKTEQAREILPNCTKTELVVTANLREWRHIFKMRTSEKADPEMKRIMKPLLKELQEKIEIIFDNI